MKKTILFSILLCGLLGLIFTSQGQTKKKDTNTKERRLVILPAGIDSAKTYSIEDEVICQIADTAIETFHYFIFDRWNIMGLQSLQKDGYFVDSLLVKLGKNISATDVLIVNVLIFQQQGVPPDLGNKTKEIVLGVAVELLNDEDEEGEKYGSNVRTEIRVQVDKINIRTGKSGHFFNMEAFYIGGNRENSKAKVMKKIKKQAQKKLKEI